jgi:hypothetical protein
MTKERSRKPSVLMSRKFSCADNLDISTIAKPSDPSPSNENDQIQIKLQALTFSDESLWIKEAVDDVKAKSKSILRIKVFVLLSRSSLIIST